MDKAQFWRIIEQAKQKAERDCEAQAKLLRSSLSSLSVDEVVGFDKVFNEFRLAAYRWDLWGAAYLINGGGSDDGFEYFRWWLIGQGKAIFEAALAQPDSLADLITTDIVWGDGQLECEDIAYVAMEVYQKKTGRKMSDAEVNFSPSEPVGVKWNEGDLDTLFPKIAARINEDK